MLRRLGILALALAVVGGFTLATTSCAKPYSGKPDRLRKPKKKKKPEAEEGEAAAGEVAFDDKCRTNFFDPPKPNGRKKAQAKQLAQAAEPMLIEAEGKEGQGRITTVSTAMGKLRNALAADPYQPLATYKLAVAYTLVGKKGCALKLLERLNSLTKIDDPRTAKEAELTVNRALNEPVFDAFQQDAAQALGR
jgi:hypothetical protein